VLAAGILPGSLVMMASALQTPPPSTQLFNNVYNWYYYLGIASGAVTFALIGYILYRYRSRPGKEIPTEKTRENRETWRGPIVTFVLMGIVLVAVGAQTFIALPTYLNPPNDAGKMTVNVTAQQFFFSFTYPNNKSSTVLVVPVGEEIVLNVTSRDVNHQFGIPDFRVKTDAIPGRYNVVWIQPNTVANYTIQCFELCGVGHATMITTLAVLPESSFDTWYNATGSA
jgi:cytochrome c oxidase subunit II